MTEIKHYIVETANGTRWGAKGISREDALDKFVTIGCEVVGIEEGKLWSDEFEVRMKRDKATWRAL
jgi:hypothetical protein